jgi:hypothetical protein
MNDLVTIKVKFVWPRQQLMLYLGIRKKRYDKRNRIKIRLLHLR